LKLSGEALGGPDGSGINQDVLRDVSNQVLEVYEGGFDLAIVVGAGNIFRGLQGAAQGMDRVQADQMGMLATVINAMALHDALRSNGIAARVMSAIHVSEVVEPYSPERAIRHLEKNVVILAGGTGNPYFTTDTAAALRAVEMQADCVLKATKVDGVYDKDPIEHPDAKRYSSVTFDQCLTDRIGVMDATAFALCRENNMPVRVFSMTTPGSLQRVCAGEDIGTLVTP